MKLGKATNVKVEVRKDSDLLIVILFQTYISNIKQIEKNKTWITWKWTEADIVYITSGTNNPTTISNC